MLGTDLFSRMQFGWLFLPDFSVVMVKKKSIRKQFYCVDTDETLQIF